MPHVVDSQMISQIVVIFQWTMSWTNVKMIQNLTISFGKLIQKYLKKCFDRNIKYFFTDFAGFFWFSLAVFLAWDTWKRIYSFVQSYAILIFTLNNLYLKPSFIIIFRVMNLVPSQILNIFSMFWLFLLNIKGV